MDDLLALGRRLDDGSLSITQLASELLHVRGRNGKLQPLIANAAQQKFEQQRTQQNIVLKARQMGMTTWIAARFFLHTITHQGMLTVQVAHTQAAVEAIFRVVQRMWEHLPETWRKGALKRSRANVGQMVFPALDSEFRVWSAADINAGRGLSIQNLHCSEVSRWQGDASATLAGLRAALAPGGELVLESTPNGAYGAFYEEWKAGELTRHFFPWWLEPAYVGTPVASDRVTEIELALMEEHHLTPERIGYRRGLERQYGKLRSQEFAEDAETCFRATGQCLFELEVIEQRLEELAEPVDTMRNGALLRWLRPRRNRSYIVAVDTAGGDAHGDFAAIQVIDMATGAQCAELQERLRPRDLAEVVAQIARDYNHALIAVERNNHGSGVLAYLDSLAPREQLYPRHGEPGWLTSAASRPEMLARLNVLLTQEPERFTSKRLLGECRTFVSGEGGKSAAASGAHDDLVLAMAIAQSVRAEVLPKQRAA